MDGLYEIKDSVQEICEAMASVLNMDVIVSDCDFRKVGDTKKHFDLEVKEIKDTYVLGKVLRTGIAQVIPSQEASEDCRACVERDKCNLKSMICVPIEDGGRVMGAMGLIAITEAARDQMLERQVSHIDYMERMADLIVSKCRERRAAENLLLTKNMLASIMDSIEEGIAAVDGQGAIVYANSILEEILGASRECLIGRNILERFTESYVHRLLEESAPFSNVELHLRGAKGEVQALLSGRPVSLAGKTAGSIFVVKKMEDVYEVINNLTASAQLTSFDEIIGTSPQIMQLKEKALRVAKGDSNILITGESGTGKELFARAIHSSSWRSKKPFIALNCSAMPEALIESELFGYEDSSFTGAARGGRPGKFQLAHGGTILMDEVGDMPLHLQPKLLRVLQERTVERIGGHKSYVVDVRVIAATNKDLEQMVERGEFREDLYYRLNVIPLHIPPLRERTGDVRLLLPYLLRKYNQKLGKQIKGLTANAERALLDYRWKGNVRELANVMEYSANMETTAYITMGSLPHKFRQGAEGAPDVLCASDVRQAEQKLIRETLARYGDSVTCKRQAARALGLSLSTLYRKIKEMGLS
jgi:sigma-54 dependent transcriptional regulator, acetoin dehydrogenase operon transcriptional activator AcoR